MSAIARVSALLQRASELVLAGNDPLRTDERARGRLGALVFGALAHAELDLEPLTEDDLALDARGCIQTAWAAAYDFEPMGDPARTKFLMDLHDLALNR